MLHVLTFDHIDNVIMVAACNQRSVDLHSIQSNTQTELKT